jgi:hypothetical protein
VAASTGGRGGPPSLIFMRYVWDRYEVKVLQPFPQKSCPSVPIPSSSR